MSNSEPSAIVRQGIPCMCGLYTSFDSNGENGSLKVCRGSPFLNRAGGFELACKTTQRRASRQLPKGSYELGRKVLMFQCPQAGLEPANLRRTAESPQAPQSRAPPRMPSPCKLSCTALESRPMYVRRRFRFSAAVFPFMLAAAQMAMSLNRATFSAPARTTIQIAPHGYSGWAHHPLIGFARRHIHVPAAIEQAAFQPARQSFVVPGHERRRRMAVTLGHRYGCAMPRAAAAPLGMPVGRNSTVTAICSPPGKATCVRWWRPARTPCPP